MLKCDKTNDKIFHLYFILPNHLIDMIFEIKVARRGETSRKYCRQ